MTCTVEETAVIRRTYGRDMRAEEIAEDYPVVSIDSDAFEAARLIAEHSLPGLVVTDASGKPSAVLPAFEILRFMMPRYVRDDPTLAGVLGESADDQAAQHLAGKRVEELLPEYLRNIPSADARDTAIKVAAQMAQLRTPLIAVTKDGKLHGVITASRLLAAALKS
jgi:CBS domain-containing protein